MIDGLFSCCFLCFSLPPAASPLGLGSTFSCSPRRLVDTPRLRSSEQGLCIALAATFDVLVFVAPCVRTVAFACSFLRPCPSQEYFQFPPRGQRLYVTRRTVWLLIATFFFFLLMEVFPFAFSIVLHFFFFFSPLFLLGNRSLPCPQLVFSGTPACLAVSNSCL